ncbi:MAG: hypothetical protein ACP5VQ_10555, partial [Phycisphaerae bacterium]
STDGYVADATGTTAGIGVAYNYQTVDQMAFTLTSATAYNFDVNGSLAHSGTISGSIVQLSFFDNGGGSNSDVQFTDLSVISAVPTPATAGLVFAGGIGLAAVLLYNRRRFGRKAQPV